MIILRQHQFQKSEYYQTASLGAAKYFISSSHRNNIGKIAVIIWVKVNINFNYMDCTIIILIELTANIYGTDCKGPWN